MAFAPVNSHHTMLLASSYAQLNCLHANRLPNMWKICEFLYVQGLETCRNGGNSEKWVKLETGENCEIVACMS